MKTNEMKKASAKSVNNYIKFWNNLKENKGTINKCIVDFRNSCLLAEENEFTKFCLSLFGDKSNKVLNGEYYSEIKTTFKIGAIVTYKKNNDTTIQYERKCSEYDVYRYFYQLYKERK